MTALGEYRAGLVDKLKPGAPSGVAVTLNPAGGPPMILVDMVTGLSPQGVGLWVCEVPIKCITQPPGDASAVSLLEFMAEHVLAVLGFAPFSPGVYRPTVDIENPMIVLTYPALISDPNC